MSTPERRRLRGLPIGLQLVLLLLASLVVAHTVSTMAILLNPPPRPPIYRVEEVAAALKGGSLTARLGPPMRRETAQTLPEDLERSEGFAPLSAASLARALGAAEADVRLVQRHRGPVRSRLHLRTVGPRDLPPAHRPPRFVELNDGRNRIFMGEPPIVGDFAAAVRRPEGGWTIVRSSPEPFPNLWQRRMMLWLAVGFLVVAPAGLLIARRITAPLKRFSEAAERLGRDPNAPPMKVSGPAEVGAAAVAFNEMQARLKRYVDDRTAMMGAISHDLRTPLARMRFKLEAAPPKVRESVLADVAQMEKMIAGVLAFIRDESTPRTRERLDLLSLVECVADDAATLGADVEIEEGEPLAVDGDPVALQRLFGNLVDNAVKYGRSARIRVRREGETAVVTIADAGPGLSPEELEQAFQPFYRADASRNLDQGGVGLGLPIARSTARAHGGEVELASGAGGLTAIVTLPLAA